MPPPWLIGLAVAWLTLGVGSAIVILADMRISKPMLMPVMRWVWPINALYMGPIAIWAYWSMDRVTKEQVMRHMEQSRQRGTGGQEGTRQTPHPH